MLRAVPLWAHDVLQYQVAIACMCARARVGREAHSVCGQKGVRRAGARAAGARFSEITWTGGPAADLLRKQRNGWRLCTTGNLQTMACHAHLIEATLHGRMHCRTAHRSAGRESLGRAGGTAAGACLRWIAGACAAAAGLHMHISNYSGFNVCQTVMTESEAAGQV
jgi:hypothetical protein